MDKAGRCNVVQFALGYVSVSECEYDSVKMTQSNSTRSSNDRSRGEMEEDTETAKPEFKLGINVLCTRCLYAAE